MLAVPGGWRRMPKKSFQVLAIGLMPVNEEFVLGSG